MRYDDGKTVVKPLNTGLAAVLFFASMKRLAITIAAPFPGW